MSTFAGSTADVYIDPIDRGPIAGAHILIFTADPNAGGVPITDLTDYSGNSLPGYVPTDAAGGVAFKTVTSYDSVYGRDPAGNVYRYDSWESRDSAAVAGRMFPTVSANASQALGLATSSASASAAALDLATRTSTALSQVTIMTPDLFGAVGDGVTSDSQAIQDCINALDALGGGTLIFTPGKVYAVDDMIELRSNIRFFGAGSIVKHITNAHAVVFFAKSHGATGYGSGVTNVRFDQCHFLGDFANTIQFNFELHHAADFVWDQCVFEQCQIGGHVFDCGGCENFTWRDCISYGCRLPDGDSGAAAAEWIELDVSLAGAMSSIRDDDGSYDGLYSRRFQVIGCKWLPLTLNGVTYPSARCIIGAHAMWEGHYWEDVVLRDVLVVDPQNDDVTTATTPSRGLIHFNDIRGLTIDNLTVKASQPTNLCILQVINGTSGRFIGSDPNLEVDQVPTGTWTAPNQSQRIKLHNVTIDGFTQVPGSANPKTAIAILGQSSMPVKGIWMANCSITNSYKPLRIDYGDQVRITNTDASGDAQSVTVSTGVTNYYHAGNTWDMA